MKDPVTAPLVKQGSIQEVYEKLGFRILEGYSEFEETWESPTVLVLTGSTEMENDNGLVLKTPLSCRIEFGRHFLDIGNVRPTPLVA